MLVVQECVRVLISFVCAQIRKILTSVLFHRDVREHLL